MDLWRSISGMVEVELISADPAAALQSVNDAGIELLKIRQEGDLTLCFCIDRRNYRRLRKLAQTRGDRLSLRMRRGAYWNVRRLLSRPVLLLGVGFLAMLTLFLPSRIYFIEVEGNTSVPTRLILERAGECGIEFGVSRREIRSEKMKNALLEAVPELQWAGINTYGCRAVISVKERTDTNAQIETHGVSSIVAVRDGVIRQITVKQGNRLCKVGQAVKAGQVLISGYTDCGICIRATKAEGEVYAETAHSVNAVMPMHRLKKEEIVGQEKKYSLIIGKKQINFCKGSGISTTTCDKMYSVNYITLPGGFRLPIGLVTETLVYYDAVSDTMDRENPEQILSEFADDYLIRQMNAGQIEQAHRAYDAAEGLCSLRGDYICVEMIGKTRLEENLDIYEAD